jgi:putative Mn2+ efflux pump MntP
MRKLFEIGGAITAVVLVLFGVAAIVMGYNGRNTVRDSLKAEQIVGTPDMTATGIAAEAKAAGLPATIKLPTANIANKPIDTGARARDFAEYMRIHALEATGGVTYSQMPRYATADGKGTNDPNAALKGKSGQPLDNAARNVWVTETALSTALNASYLAENVALFSIVIGFALLLIGIGFGILVAVGSLRDHEAIVHLFGERKPKEASTKTKTVPAS